MTGKVISEKKDYYWKITGSNQSPRLFLMKTVLLIFSLLVCSESSQIFAQTSELKVSSSSFTIPVVLTQESTIESLDVKISGYNPAFIEKTDVSLTGGILENKDYSLSDNSTSDSVSIVLYAQNTPISGKGNILFITFNIKADGDITLSLDILDLNESPADGGFEINGTVSRNVKIVMNHAPVLDNTFSPVLTPIQEDSFNSQGNTVSEIIIDNSVTDDDAPASKAMAVISVDNTGGKWEYSLDNGNSWSVFTETAGISETLALFRLLDSTDRIRFVPNPDWNGTASFIFRAWDKTEGTPGGTADVSEGGGIYPFSLATDTASIQIIPVNDAPVLDDTFSHVCYSIEENQIDSSGTGISEIISDGSITDIDGSPAEAIAVTAADNTNGIWEYSLDNGAAWEPFQTSEVSDTQALLLAETHKIRFVPNTDWNGIANFTFRAWDKTGGTSGGIANATLNGGITAFSVKTDTASIKVGAVNDAPVLDDTKSPILTAITEDDTNSKGTVVSEIIADGSVTDIDGPVVKAMAVIGVDNTGGIWEYSLDNGEIWYSFADSQDNIILNEARLLDGTVIGNETNRIRFSSNPDWNGVASFTFRAWDKSSGTAGETADTNMSGGTSALSLESDQASITVTPVNDAPVLDSLQSHILYNIAENNTTSSGNSISVIIADNSISDSDVCVGASPCACPEAIAVIGADNTNGIWQYSLNNGITWKNFTDETAKPVEFPTHARLLDGTLSSENTHKIRFVPNPDWNGTATFTFRAWDKTAGIAGESADTTDNGGTSAFSLAKDEAVIQVKPVNNAPVLNDTFSPMLTPINEDDTDNPGNSVSDIISDGSITDLDGSPTEAMAVISVDNTNGKWQ